MKLRTTNNKIVDVSVWYSPMRYDSYTILVRNDLYGCTPDVDQLHGYAGSITEAGYKDREDYHIWAQENYRKVGQKVTNIQEVATPVAEWIEQIINSEV